MEKYSRDDVIQALRAQLTTLTCVKQRWRPLAAQGRGGRHPVAELPLAAKPSGLQETVPGLRPFSGSSCFTRRSDDESAGSSSSSSSSDGCASADEAAKGEEAAVNANVVLAQ